MITVYIDGVAAEVDQGTTILDAAKQVGITIPSLCYLKELGPDGSCRMCTVEVEEKGCKRFVSSCSELCCDGMNITTSSAALTEFRKTILSLMMEKHAKSCFSCDKTEDCIHRQRPFCGFDQNCYSCPKNADCDFRKLCMEYKVFTGAVKDYKAWKPIQTRAAGIVYDRNRCILCRRCVRACAAECGDDRLLAYSGKGCNAEIMWVGDISAFKCMNCMKCVELCPTGALFREEDHE